MIKLLVTAATALLLLTPPAGAQNAAPPAANSAPAPAPVAAPPPAAAGGERIHVDGFRAAKWGMNEADVKNASLSDFKIPLDKLKAERNPNEKTLVLTIAVPDLIDGTGVARVTYIFGYTTKKLIQVNIVWGTPADPQAKPEMVVAAANQLRQLFLDEGYDPATVVTNTRAANGAIVVFQGQDADKHTTLLRLVSAPDKSDKEAKGDGKAEGKDKPAPATALFLSYVMDAASPDVYRLKKGQF